jgi:hypothetical protein
MAKMRVKLVIQVVALESNETYDEGDTICNLQTVLNEEHRPKTSLELRDGKILWMEQLGDREMFSDVKLDKK